MRFEHRQSRGNAVGESPNPDWMNQWQALARQYTNAWQDASRGAAGAQPSAAAPMEGFEQWSRLFSSGAGGQGETIERLIDSTKRYATYMQSLLAVATANAQGSNVPWGNAFAQGFAGSGGGTPLFEHPAARAWREMAGQGGNGFASFMGALRAPPNADLGELKAWLNLPAFGSARQHQEHYQKMAVVTVEYQEQMSRYNALMLKASQRGFELFEGKLAEREQPGRQIESLRALYDLWVDAAEEGYAEVALSAEFREVYGALVNAQMRVRAQVQQGVEHIGSELGMPTRSELDSIGERLQALRREVRERGNGAGDGLADEVARLREEFAAIKAGAKGTPQGAGGATKAKTETEPQRKVGSAKKHAPRTRAVPTAAPAPEKVQAPKKAQVPKKAQALKKAQASKKRARTEKGASKATVKHGTQRATVAPVKVARAPRKVQAKNVSGAGNFASRIAKFAKASLGASRARAHRPEERARPSKSGKAR